MKRLMHHKYSFPSYQPRQRRKSKRDCRIARSVYDGAEDKCAAVIAKAVEFVWPSNEAIERTEIRFHNLTPSMKIMMPVVELATEVEAGGFLRYFHGESSWFAFNALDGLEQIGAREQAKVLKQALRIFPDAKVPRNNHRRRCMLPEYDGEPLIAIKQCDLPRMRLYESRLNMTMLSRLRKCDFDWRTANRGKSSVLKQLGPKFIEERLDEFVQ